MRSWLLSDSVTHGQSSPEILEQINAEIPERSHNPLSIHVSTGMQRASGVRFGSVQVSDWNEDRLIPAKLELDPARHYAVTAPADVIVEELSRPLGQTIRRGEPLLEMSSSQLTTLRGGLARQQLLTMKAQRSVEWHRAIEKRVSEIIEKIEATSRFRKALDESRSHEPNRTFADDMQAGESLVLRALRG